MTFYLKTRSELTGLWRDAVTEQAHTLEPSRQEQQRPDLDVTFRKQIPKEDTLPRHLLGKMFIIPSNSI